MSRELISPEGLRLDGRRAKEVRRVACELGLFSKVDGSAFYEQGNTKVSVSVFGPREAQRRADAAHDRAVVTVEYAVAAFSTSERKAVSKNDRRSAEAALLIRQTFEQAVLTSLFPRSEIAVFVSVLQADGGELAAAINATTLAMVNAGIPMRAFVCACSGGFADGAAVLDVNYLEKSMGCAEMVVACDPQEDSLYMAQMTSKLPLANFEEVTALAREGCVQIHKVLRQRVMEYSLSRKG